MEEQRREEENAGCGLRIWWNLNRLRGPVRKAPSLNPAPLPPAGESRAYASSLSRCSGACPGSLQPRLFPRCASGFPKGFYEFGFAPSLPKFLWRTTAGELKSPVCPRAAGPARGTGYAAVRKNVNSARV